LTSRPHPNQRPAASLAPELRSTTVPAEVRHWIARKAGTVVRVRRLPGASTTAVHAVVLSDGRRLVLRRYVWQWVLEDEPVVPQREVDALRFACAAGLGAPEVVAADVDGSIIGDGVPVILMTMLSGRAEPLPDVNRLAETAASIHAIDASGLGHEYSPWYVGTTAAPPPAATWPELWEAALEVWRTRMPQFKASLIHRDFHPGNVLWVRGRCSGVVDWASSCLGPWECDVAHCRENLIRLGGPDVADRFLRAYQTFTGADFHPYWEVASVLEHGPSHWTPTHVSQAEQRLEAALAVTGQLPRGR
jgi:aminoglycoside phosphotransferase (APT) family kinase protein